MGPNIDRCIKAEIVTSHFDYTPMLYMHYKAYMTEHDLHSSDGMEGIASCF